MPPKKESKKITDRPHYDYPVNECKFIITVDIEHEKGSQLKLKYDWLDNAA